jgi:hypothetical protein
LACCADRRRSGWHPFEIKRGRVPAVPVRRHHRKPTLWSRSAFSLIYNASDVINFAQGEFG